MLSTSVSDLHHLLKVKLLAMLICIVIINSKGITTFTTDQEGNEDANITTITTTTARHTTSSSPCGPDNDPDGPNEKNQFQDYKSYNREDQPYFGRILIEDMLYLANFQYLPFWTMYIAIGVSIAMVIFFGIVLVVNEKLNGRRQKRYFNKVHAAWGHVHGIKEGGSSRKSSVSGKKMSAK